jgi:hypothetical protein
MKKKIILTIMVFILLFVDIYLFFNFIYVRFKNKSIIEKYDLEIASQLENSPFEIEKIILFSSASGINKNTNFQNSNWLLDIFEYTDIAIYFSQPENLDVTNTVQNLSISNIKLNVESEKYTPSLYYLDANNFGTDSFLDDNKIENNLEFSVLNFDNANNSIMYNTPVFFADLSNPITLKFTNTLLTNYSLENTEKLIFDGSLISKTPLSLENLKASLSFDINITNYNNENYYTNVIINIPTENDEQSILDGSILETQNTHIYFLKEIK